MSTHDPIHPHTLHTAHFSFVDTHGRRIHLRGVNLSGSSKAPLDQPSHVLKDFWENAEKGGGSFVGQPLNLEDGSADEHLARLRGWGFNLLRFPVTWEALEHAGPKKYDYEFMDYIVRVLSKCKQYGFRVYMDPHQDTWSRFSGGSGAPFWTLPACGINPYNLSSTQAALIHSEWPLPHLSDPTSFPAMIWGTNYGRLFSLTLFTLFFAGRAFAPNCIIDDVNIQDYLQSHYIAAFGQLADRICRADEEEGLELRDACIIGWDSLNEPAEGFTAWDDLNSNPVKQGTTLKKGTFPTPAQSLRLGMGQQQTVETWDFGTFGPKRTGTATIDPKGRKIWADPDFSGDPQGGERPDGTHPRWGWKRDVDKWPLGTCIWALHGVWDVESGFILRPDYFKYHPSTGIEVHFLPDFWLPHFAAYTTRIRSSHPHSILFVQPPVFALPPPVGEDLLKGRCAYTGHYYDGLTLITKHWNWFNADSLGVLRGKYKSPMLAVKFGEKAIRKSIMEQIRTLKADAELITAPAPSISTTIPTSTTSPPRRLPQPNQYPTVIGEIGTPFDMDSKRSYFPASPSTNKYRGDYSNQEKALDASLNACDGYNNVNYTVWTYLARGHSHEWGDGWNGEDLSLWSPDDSRKVWSGDEDREVDEAKNGAGTVDRLRKKRKIEGKALKSESQAGLLANRSTTNVLASKNPSALSLETISSTKAQREGSPLLSTPFASTSSSAASSSRTSLDDDDVDEAPETTTATNDATSTVTTVLAVDEKDKSSTPASSTILDHYQNNTDNRNRLRDEAAEADPYDFLTDGARAVRAFCRPRPIKVWGEVVDTQFEIGKAEFKCVIQVGTPSSASHTDDEDRDRDQDQDEEEKATEIYLPLVHFASTDLLENSKARWSQPINREMVDADLKTSKLYGGEDVPSDGSGDETGDREREEKRFFDSIEHREDLLDVEVRVSSGKWKIRGQTLYWWYPRCHLRGEEERAGGEQVTIEVKRRGGAIKVLRGGWVDVPPRSKATLRSLPKDGRRRKSLCERLCDCDFGCVVM